MPGAEREHPPAPPRPCALCGPPSNPVPTQRLCARAFPSEFGPGPSSYVASRPWHVSLRAERLTVQRFHRMPGAGQSWSLRRGLVCVWRLHRSDGHLSPAWAFAPDGPALPCHTALGRAWPSRAPRELCMPQGTSHRLFLFSPSDCAPERVACDPWGQAGLAPGWEGPPRGARYRSLPSTLWCS